MNRLYTAVGCLHIDGQQNGKRVPIVKLKGQEYILDIQEFIVWSILNWRILRIEQVKELYEAKENETGFYASRSFDDCICRLLQRGLLAEGSGDTGKEALYALLADLYIVPISENLLLRLWSFIRLCVFGKVPYSVAKKILKRDKRTADERKVMYLAKQMLLSTAEIVKCFGQEKVDFCCEEELLDLLYGDDVTTSDNLADTIRYLSECRPVITSVANLYLRRQIILERL